MSLTRVCRLSLVLALLPLFGVRAAPLLDEGKLDPAWFGGDREFRRADGIDYLWVRPGFKLDGRTVHFAAWEEPHWRGQDASVRDTKDKSLAKDLSANMPEAFTKAFRNGLAGTVTVVESGGEFEVSGRIVDVSGGSGGSGSSSTTFDLKFVDAKSGELVAGLHHRVVSGSKLPPTGSKLVQWVDGFVGALTKRSFSQIYNASSRTKE